MTAPPKSLPLDATLYEAARLMRDQGIGDVLVTFAAASAVSSPTVTSSSARSPRAATRR
ncbi:hypothetical protein [Actinomadura madurae]|uniref:hypothetical protein n=1 Tax=Actinomadura madurae TaxID=1993 RepID=UPI0020D239AB|nr:hypothetical protein [Actinomadura madurae]MCP9970103.1 hypothetical protein [Actinomadura madurae]MCQ0018812.1 hypothetical protein [Actinomadura madurae]